jgi:hypothetical protein
MSPLPDKGKYFITIYPITIYHGPQFRCDRIAAAFPAATAVANISAVAPSNNRAAGQPLRIK